MAVDRIGDTLARAKPIGLKANLTEQIGGKDRKDFLSFRLTSSSNVKTTLNSANRNLSFALLNQAGRTIQQITGKARSSRRVKQMNRLLEAGTYYLRVTPGQGKTASKYRLTLSATPLPPPVSPPEPPPVDTFDIQFDYRFDTDGWFTPEKRAALEVAASVWESIIQDRFADLPPGSFQGNVINPQTGQPVAFTNEATIDDLLIFVGRRDVDASLSRFATNSGDLLSDLAPNYNARVGSIAFDAETGNVPTSWFFDPTPTTSTDVPGSQYDFITIALSAIGGVFGTINTVTAFNALTTSNQGANFFNGTNAVALNGGNPIPLAADGSSIQDGFLLGGSEPLFTFGLPGGKRKLPTALDLAIIDDIGYTVDYAKASQNFFAVT